MNLIYSYCALHQKWCWSAYSALKTWEYSNFSKSAQSKESLSNSLHNYSITLLLSVCCYFSYTQGYSGLLEPFPADYRQRWGSSDTWRKSTQTQGEHGDMPRSQVHRLRIIFEWTLTLQDERMTGLTTADTTSRKSPKKKKKKKKIWNWMERTFCGSIGFPFEELVVVDTYQKTQPRGSGDVLAVP